MALFWTPGLSTQEVPPPTNLVEVRRTPCPTSGSDGVQSVRQDLSLVGLFKELLLLLLAGLCLGCLGCLLGAGVVWACLRSPTPALQIVAPPLHSVGEERLKLYR